MAPLSSISRDSKPPLVTRLAQVPVITPEMVPGYGAIFNAGLLFYEGLYHLFARGVRSGYAPGPVGGPRYVDYVSDVLVFTSADALTYQFAYTLCVAGESGHGCVEDPRVQIIKSGGTHVVMTFTNLLSTGFHHIGAHVLNWDGERFRLPATPMQLLGPPHTPNKDAVLFNTQDGRVALLHRIHPDVQLALFDDLNSLWNATPQYWDDYLEDLAKHVILSPSPGALGIGAGAPPIKVEAGLLFFYHERRADGVYTMNVALLDPSTARVQSLLTSAVMSPELPWERHGDVDNVVFVQGACLRGDEIYLVYGAADRCVGAAYARVQDLTTALRG
jgi:predicted GH43/DUF377 family glycosyl hydrolase